MSDMEFIFAFRMTICSLLFIAAAIFLFYNRFEVVEIAEVTDINHPDHLPPDTGHPFYKEGFVRTNKCNYCSMVAYVYQMHRANPCRRCGGKMIENGAAKWDELNGQKQWVKPELNK